MRTSTSLCHFYRPQHSCSKVMFLHLSVIRRHPLGRQTPPLAGRHLPHPGTATAADGTHLTGVHSCCNSIYIKECFKSYLYTVIFVVTIYSAWMCNTDALRRSSHCRNSWREFCSLSNFNFPLDLRFLSMVLLIEINFSTNFTTRLRIEVKVMVECKCVRTWLIPRRVV